MVDITVSFVSDEQLSEIDLRIKGPVDDTGTLADFSRKGSGVGPYTYTATGSIDTWGEYEVFLRTAKDMEGNDGADSNVQKDIVYIDPTFGYKSYYMSGLGSTLQQYSNQEAFSYGSMTLEQEVDLSSDDGDFTGMAWNDDGTALFLVAGDSNTLYHYRLDVAYEITTMRFLDAYDLSGVVGSPEDISWSADGERFFIVDAFGNEVHSFEVGDHPFILSSISHRNTYSVDDASFPRSMAWNHDGTEFYILSGSDDVILQYTTFTPFSIDSNDASYYASLDTSSQVSSVYDFLWNGNGTQLQVVDSNNSRMVNYECIVPFNIKSAFHEETVSVDTPVPYIVSWDGETHY